MISEEYLEIVIMGLVKCRINVVVISTGIWGILHFEVLHEYKIFNDLHFFNLSVFCKEGSYGLLSSIIESTYIELPDKDALVYFFGRLSLLHKLFLLWLRQFSKHLMDG